MHVREGQADRFGEKSVFGQTPQCIARAGGAGKGPFSLKVGRQGTGAENGLTIFLQPAAQFQRTLPGAQRQTAIRLGTDIQCQIAAFSYDINEQMDQFAAGFQFVLIAEGERMADGHAALPGHRNEMIRHLLFGRDIVFGFTAHSPVRHQESGIFLAQAVDQVHQMDILMILGLHLTAVQPENINGSEIFCDFGHLFPGKVNELVPQFRPEPGIVRGIAPVRNGQVTVRSPVVRAVPVRLGKIRCNGNAVTAEGIEEVLGNIGILVGVEGAGGIRDLVGGHFGIPHAEAVMMLGGEDEIPESHIIGKLRPLFRLKAQRIEGAVQVCILLAEEFIVLFPVISLPGPGRVLSGERPGFGNAELGIDSPVYHEAKLLILEPFQALPHCGLFGPYIIRIRGVIDNIPAQGVLGKL